MAPENQPVTQQAVAVEKPTPAASKPSLPIRLPKDKWKLLQLAAGIIIGIWTIVNLALLWVNGIDPKAVIWALWWPAIFIIQYTVFTTPWRAITVKELARMFFIGMGLVFFASYWSELIMTGIIKAYPNINPIYIILRLPFVLGPGVNILADVASPICEETFKILPVIVFLLIAGRGYWRRALGPLDVALLGGASGAGFLFMENIARYISGYWDKLGPDRSVSIASPGFNPFYIFPDMYHGGSSVWMGHPEATMFVGLGLGFGLMLRKKTRLWPVIPAIAFLWVTWLHFMINGFDTAGNTFWGTIVFLLHLNGGLIGYFLEFGLLAAIIVSMVVKFWYMKNDKQATVGVVLKEVGDYAKANSGQPVLLLKKLWSLRHFWSFRHAVAYGVFYTTQLKPSQVTHRWTTWLGDLRRQALGQPKYKLPRAVWARFKNRDVQEKPASST